MGLSQMTFFSLISLILVLQEFVIAATIQLQSTSPNSSLITLPWPIPAPSVNGSKNKFVIRKCCGPGRLYNYNAGEKIPDADRCVKYSVSSSRPLSPALNKSRGIFLGSKQNYPSQYSIEDVKVDVGFPRNCTPDSGGLILDYLEPWLRMGDVFYALSSGQLLVPHKFLIIEYDKYCIDDYTEKRNFTKVQRIAVVCSMPIRFPTIAIDNSGKLRLDFLQSDEDAELFASKFNGRRVIRKCCRQSESLNSLSAIEGRPRCRENQDLVTRFFENLQLNEKSNDLFFRFGLVNCSNPPLTTEFQLHFNGSLEIKMSGRKGNSSNLLVSIEDYCLDDMVEFDYYTSLPSTSTYAMHCSGEEPSFMESELIDRSELTESPFTEQTFNEPTFTDTTISEPVFNYPNNDSQHGNPTVFKIPKCCPYGHVMSEEYICQPLWWWPSQEYEDEPTEPAKIVLDSINKDFKNYFKIWSVIFNPNTTFNGSCRSDQLQQAIPLLFANNSKDTPIFRNDSKNELSFLLHTFVENYWDLKSKIHPFCVDLLLTRYEQAVVYNAQVFHCITVEPFEIYRPVILLISTAGLLATFIIYFFVPASGSAKLVITAFGGKTNRRTSRTTTMAMMLTGRILLCHVISLALAFTCLALIQLKLVESNRSSCIAIGYIAYSSLIASFSWLTVYCFDYYHIFSGSFKVTNDRLFTPYSAFGWGVPILATITTIIAQFRSTSLGVSDTVNPNFGYDRCWFPDGNSISQMIFYHVPIGILLLLDIYFFLSLMFNSNLMYCWKRQQDVAIRSNRKISTASKEQEDLKMAVKLFFITGIPWIFEFISYLTFRLDGSHVGVYYFLECCQQLNLSRGVFIFVNFILLNRDVRKFLWSHIKIIFQREPLTLVDGNVIQQTHPGNNDLSTSNVMTQSSPATCSETISSLDSFQFDEYSYL